MSLGTQSLWHDLPMQPGIDLYQFWGMAKAQRSSGYRLGSPYRNLAGYQEQFWRMAVDAGDERLAAAISNRQAPDPTGSPLIYYLFGSLPGPYAATLQAYRIVQLLCFLLAAFLLARPVVSHAVTALILAAVLAAAYAPLLFDLAVANVNCFQLLGLILVALAVRATRNAHGGLPFPYATSLLSALVLLSLAKPNFDSATALLGLCVLLNAKTRSWQVLLAGAVVMVVVLLAPCVLFHSWSVWSDWWHSTFASAERIAYPVSAGNYSGVRLLADALHVSVAAAMGLAVMMLSLPLLWAVVPRQGQTFSSLGAAGRTALIAILKEPDFCLAAGIVIALALSPLVWEHYQVLAVAPALWLCRHQEQGSLLPRVAGWLSLVLFADLPENINTQGAALPVWLVELNHSFSWLLLWLGTVAQVHQHRRG